MGLVCVTPSTVYVMVPVLVSVKVTVSVPTRVGTTADVLKAVPRTGAPRVR